jgi:hypothetical protein
MPAETKGWLSNMVGALARENVIAIVERNVELKFGQDTAMAWLPGALRDT